VPIFLRDSERKKNSLFSGVKQGSYFYFAHSYYCAVGSYTGGVTNYGVDFSSFIHKDNIMAVQFHPEKSQDKGLRILHNFCKL
jgi:glutamine amidotransferase